MKIKTGELIGVALDWAVAQACGVSIRVLDADNPGEKWQTQLAGYPHGPWWPSQDWGQGGPLIERYRVGFDYRTLDEGRVMATACGMKYDQFLAGCESHLIAAMRAIVAAKLGYEVDVPEGLVS